MYDQVCQHIASFFHFSLFMPANESCSLETPISDGDTSKHDSAEDDNLQGHHLDKLKRFRFFCPWVTQSGHVFCSNRALPDSVAVCLVKIKRQRLFAEEELNMLSAPLGFESPGAKL